MDGMKFRVGIDCRSLVSGASGVATYVANLLRELPQLERISSAWPGNNFLWNQLRVPPAQLWHHWDLFHAPAYTAPLLNFCPLVLNVHDISYLVRREWYPYRLDTFRRLYYRASLRRADCVLVPSDFTRREVIRLFPKLERRMRLVYLGVSEDFRPDPGGAALARREFGLPDSYLLHVGDLHQRRNVGLIQAAARRLDLPLVFVGKVLDRGVHLAQTSRHLEGLSLDQLRGVYSGAEAFVYASVYEGFGLPLLEAMACGLPVVAVKRASVPEVCGEAAVLVEPDVGELAEGLEIALQEGHDLSSRGLERAQQFTWKKTAAETLRVYQELTHRHR
jgi:glycosyltransferase involved in cell wall biosynthesis